MHDWGGLGENLEWVHFCSHDVDKGSWWVPCAAGHLRLRYQPWYPCSQTTSQAQSPSCSGAQFPFGWWWDSGIVQRKVLAGSGGGSSIKSDLCCWHLETNFDSCSSMLDSLLARAPTDHIWQISAFGSQKGDEIEMVGQFWEIVWNMSDGQPSKTKGHPLWVMTYGICLSLILTRIFLHCFTDSWCYSCQVRWITSSWGIQFQKAGKAWYERVPCCSHCWISWNWEDNQCPSLCKTQGVHELNASDAQSKELIEVNQSCSIQLQLS